MFLKSFQFCRRIKCNLTRHRGDLHALLHESEATSRLDPELHPTASSTHMDAGAGGAGGDSVNDEDGMLGGLGANSGGQRYAKFSPREMLQPIVLYPFLVILVLMFLLQFSGQGAVTFYTALIFEEADCALDPKESSVIVGLSYLLSSILGLFLKKHVGRRILLLVSEFGMALSLISMGLYFYFLRRLTEAEEEDVLVRVDYARWLPIPILVVYTTAYNVGMGSLTWVVATEILPVRSKRWTHTISNVTSNFWWFVVTKTFRYYF